MKRNPLVSVIVPVYNAERFLDRCLSSIADQTYQNLEIILVNDGSTDSSEAICRRHMCAGRARLFSQKNQGQSAARNVGLDHMSGEYLTFVDADDYLSPSFVEILLNKCLEEGVPVAVCDYDAPGEGVQAPPPDGLKGPVPGRRIARNAIYDVWNRSHEGMQFGTVWGKVFHRDIFSGLRFPEGKIYEDVFIFHRIYHQVQEVYCTDLKLYHYVQTRNSTMRRDGVTRPDPDHLEALFERLRYFQEYGERAYVDRTVSGIINAAVELYGRQGTGRPQLRQVMLAVRKITGRRSCLMKYSLYMISPALYKWLRRRYQKLKPLMGLRR